MTSVVLPIGSNSISSRFAAASGMIWLSFALLLLLIITMIMGMFDDRLINGVNVWSKPSKFSFSLALHAVTLAYGSLLLSDELRGAQFIRRATQLFAIAALFEIAWITFQASRGEASHFNSDTTVASIMYGLMGIGAVMLTGITVIFGWKIFRSGTTPMHLATGWGFILAGVLTTLVASYMSSGTSHSVGGDVTDATGLGFFNWSTTGGDLRVSHFVALHIAQGIPFLAIVFPDRRVIITGMIGATLLVGLLFIQAVSGIPLLRV